MNLIAKLNKNAIILAMAARMENFIQRGPLLAPDGSSGGSGQLLSSPEIILLPGVVMRPMDLLVEQAQSTERSIENCWWARSIQLDFDIPEGVSLSPTNQRFKDELTASLGRQVINGKKHGIPGTPSEASDMIVGFTDLPSGDATLWDRIQEIPPMISVASKRYRVKNMLHKNYTIVVNAPDDLTSYKKRDMERHVRRAMGSLGAVKLVFINEEGQASFATLEGGLGTENILEVTNGKELNGIDKFRDRIVTHACAIESGSYDPVENAIPVEAADASEMPDYLAGILKEFGKWGYIDAPFDISSVVSKDRTALATRLLGYGRQAESAGSAQDLNIEAPEGYQMGDADGLIMSTISGRSDINLDKRNLGREGSMYVSIVPKRQSSDPNDRLNLYTFNRFALGVGGVDLKMPSIEFDEMASVYRNSPTLRVEPITKNGKVIGYRQDLSGSLSMSRIRGFVHFHGAVNEIHSARINGKNVQDIVEYIPANLGDYPYPVGCGKNVQFGASTDAALRSRGVQDLKSGIHIAFFDAIAHGTHFLALAEPIPGTDIYPANPFYMLSHLVNPNNGIMSITDEIAQI